MGVIESIKKPICDVLAYNKREHSECMKNFTKFIAIKTVRFMGKSMMSIGTRKAIEHLPVIISAVV